MKGKTTIDVNEDTIHIEGSILFSDQSEVYEVICALAQCFGVTSPRDWAELVVYSSIRGFERGTMERHEMTIPKKKENTDGRND